MITSCSALIAVLGVQLSWSAQFSVPEAAGLPKAIESIATNIASANARSLYTQYAIKAPVGLLGLVGYRSAIDPANLRPVLESGKAVSIVTTTATPAIADRYRNLATHHPEYPGQVVWRTSSRSTNIRSLEDLLGWAKEQYLEPFETRTPGLSRHRRSRRR